MSESRDAASQVLAIAEHVEQRFRAASRAGVRRIPEPARRRPRPLLARRQPVPGATRLTTTARRSSSIRGASFTRFKLFDLPWEPSTARRCRRGALVGQEHVQEEIYRALSNFVREGRPNRLILLHGPNGSAKSTMAACIMASLEHYSTLDEGALYRFHWVFPSQKTIRGSLGFGHENAAGKGAQSYAHLTDEEIDVKLLVEVRDHPLFLIPIADSPSSSRGRLQEGRGDRAAE